MAANTHDDCRQRHRSTFGVWNGYSFFKPCISDLFSSPNVV
ncbi:Uncharacterised protein [Vibrio cholerae]|nr:Uncharacterised protein [Vibrio cholerae]